jgi:hypothetical protein
MCRQNVSWPNDSRPKDLAPNSQQFIFFIAYEWSQEARAFVANTHLQPRLM